MSKKEVVRKEYNVKPRHQVIIRGMEVKEGKVVLLSDEEYRGMDMDGYKPVVPAEEFEAFMQAYNDGDIDHKGDLVSPALEAKDEEREGAADSVEA